MDEKNNIMYEIPIIITLHYFNDEMNPIPNKIMKPRLNLLSCPSYLFSECEGG